MILFSSLSTNSFLAKFVHFAPFWKNNRWNERRALIRDLGSASDYACSMLSFLQLFSLSVLIECMLIKRKECVCRQGVCFIRQVSTLIPWKNILVTASYLRLTAFDGTIFPCINYIAEEPQSSSKYLFYTLLKLCQESCSPCGNL